MKFGWRNRVKWIAPTVGVAAIALSLSLGVPDTGCGGVITSITPIDDEASEHLTGSKRCSVPNSLKPLKFDSPTAATFVEMTPIELRVSSPMGATIARVDYYNYESPIATVTTPPFSYMWQGVPPGLYNGIRARAVDVNGHTAGAIAPAFTVTRGALPGRSDTLAPSASPGEFNAGFCSAFENTAVLVWGPASEPRNPGWTGILGYRIYLNGRFVRFTTTTGETLRTFDGGTVPLYFDVSAVDGALNESGQSRLVVGRLTAPEAIIPVFSASACPQSMRVVAMVGFLDDLMPQSPIRVTGLHSYSQNPNDSRPSGAAEIISMEWECGNFTSTTEAGTCTYASAGDYHLALTVHDDFGYHDVERAIVRVPDACAVDLSTDPGWRVCSGIDMATVGQAQRVCVSQGAPDCPAGAMKYNHPGGHLGGRHPKILGADLIWAPGITGATPNASLAKYHFLRTFALPAQPLAARIKITGDDLTSVVVNGHAVGTFGSIDDKVLSQAEQDSAHDYNIKPWLHAGNNTIEVTTQNGPDWFVSVPYANYQQNPAWLVGNVRIFLPINSSNVSFGSGQHCSGDPEGM